MPHTRNAYVARKIAAKHWQRYPYQHKHYTLILPSMLSIAGELFDITLVNSNHTDTRFYQQLFEHLAISMNYPTPNDFL